MLRSQIGLQLWKNLDAEVEINSAWEMIRENIKISANYFSQLLNVHIVGDLCI
jgi:hypothetical protein